MSKELDTGKYKARVVKRTYGDGTERWVLQASYTGLAFYDVSTHDMFGGALIAKDKYEQEKAQEHIVSEEVVA